MKPSLFVLSLTLASVSAIPTTSSHNDDLLVSRADHGLVGEPFALDDRAVQRAMTYAEVKLAVAKEFNTEPATGSLSFKWDLKSECTRCKGKQVEDEKDKTKCRTCPDKTKPNPDHTKCIRDDTGCAEDEVPNEDKKCKKCPAGQKADTAGKTCVATRPEKEKGKCPDGLVLDPAEGGQDAKTEKPQCIADDDKRCPAGQSAATRRGKAPNEADYTPDCGIDDDPNHMCPDPKTFDHREIPINSDRIKHSCRSTRKTQNEMKAKYEARTKTAGSDQERKAKAEKQKKQRARSGWCWVALASIEAWPADEINALSQDEVDGLVSTWDDAVPTPPRDGQIPDYVIKFSGKAYAVVETETAGPFGFLGKIFGAGTNTATVVNALKTGTRGLASTKALQAAKNSAVVQKILKHPGYVDCLATVGAVTAGITARDMKNVKFDGKWGTYDVDWSRQPDPSIKALPPGTNDKQISLYMAVDTDSSRGTTYETYHDGYVRVLRLYYEACQNMGWAYKNSVTHLNVQGGCCTFYDLDNCQNKLFSMTNRQDGQLRGPSNDAISSFWCTFDEKCAGAP
ncbi:uncharacterized protein BP5553_00682 [Venustampulla echinocandica]|uniref:Uncharacterized protein n=1 Tax=Venustampulla echinocandica TaxID=2656787 RepID=A0A370TYV1_9HELO|nr:uncharacterized protein BP5553_00682 [Venustampulla echinocandica]RDL40703.1 hypothetical protein BP5553_00682 [Venustampulla echinocandica]